MAKSTITSLTGSVLVNGTNQATAVIASATLSYDLIVSFYIGTFETTPYREDIGITTVTSSMTQKFTVPLAWMNAIPNAVSGVAHCKVITYVAGTGNFIGEDTKTFTITVPDTVVPVVSNITFNKVADAFSPGIYASGISRANVTGISVTNAYSATTKKRQTYIYNSPYEYIDVFPYDGYFTSGVLIQAYQTGLQNPETVYLTTVVTDSRGHLSDPYTESVQVYQYAAPTLTITAVRCDAAGLPNATGDYIKIRVKGKTSSVGGDNTVTYSLKYKRSIDSTWTTIDVSALGAGTVDSSYIRSASGSYTWNVSATVQDKVNTLTKTTNAVSETATIDFLSGGGGIAFGKPAETEIFDCNWPANFSKEITGVGLSLMQLKLRTVLTAAADASDKGSAPGHVPLDSILEISFSNGNTAANPTIAIGGITYTLSDIPTLEKSTSGYQTYRFRKINANTLAYLIYPDYITEYGLSNSWTFRRWASGWVEFFIQNATLTMAPSVSFGSLFRYVSNGTGGAGLYIPTYFTETPIVEATFIGSSSTKSAPHGFPVLISAGNYHAHLQYLGAESNASPSSQSVNLVVRGQGL